MNIKINTVFSYQTTLENIAAASEASANILLSHDVGYAFARKMEDEFGIPLIAADIPLPMGCSNTARWLRTIADYFDVDKEIVDKIINDGEERVVDILRRRGLMIIPRYRNCHVAVSADATYGIGLIKMLFEELEMIPDVILIRSGNKYSKKLLKRELESMNLSPLVAFEADGYVIKQALASAKVDAVLGSSWENYISQETDIKLAFDLLTPTNRDIYLDKAYFGYEGMLNMLEVLGNDWERQFRSRSIVWSQYTTYDD